MQFRARPAPHPWRGRPTAPRAAVPSSPRVCGASCVQARSRTRGESGAARKIGGLGSGGAQPSRTPVPTSWRNPRMHSICASHGKRGWISVCAARSCTSRLCPQWMSHVACCAELLRLGAWWMGVAIYNEVPRASRASRRPARTRLYAVGRLTRLEHVCCACGARVVGPQQHVALAVARRGDTAVHII